MIRARVQGVSSVASRGLFSRQDSGQTICLHDSVTSAIIVLILPTLWSPVPIDLQHKQSEGFINTLIVTKKLWRLFKIKVKGVVSVY